LYALPLHADAGAVAAAMFAATASSMK